MSVKRSKNWTYLIHIYKFCLASFEIRYYFTTAFILYILASAWIMTSLPHEKTVYATLQQETSYFCQLFYCLLSSKNTVANGCKLQLGQFLEIRGGWERRLRDGAQQERNAIESIAQSCHFLHENWSLLS